MKNWYSITNKTSGVLDISIHHEIGMYGVSASEFLAELKENNDVKSINLSIHSPGGNVLDGFAIYHALKGHKAKVYGHVAGLAASAASFILMASDYITMPENARIMIHNAHGGAYGEAEDLREMAELIEDLQESIVSIYTNRTGIDSEEIKELMSVETWMDGAEALEKGFADTISDSIEIAAKAGSFENYFKEIPFDKVQPEIENIETIKDFVSYLRNAGGLSRKAADALTARAKALFLVSEEPEDETAKQILSALNKVKVPDCLDNA